MNVQWQVIAKSRGNSNFDPLYCHCISAKRYALFNKQPSGEIVIRKASAHGLGHYLAPYDADDAPQSIPTPSVALDKIGVERWHYDLWHSVISAALDGHPYQVGLSYHLGLGGPAVSRYGATTPKLLSWFKQLNSGCGYGDQVKPFNFLIAFQGRPDLTLTDSEICTPKRGRPRKPSPIRPVASFSRNIGEAAEVAFDRETGTRVEPSLLMIYAETLAQYHLRPESKFLSAEHIDRGRTGRRHVIATQILHIGKEANKWEEQYFLGPDDEAEIEYDTDQSRDGVDARVQQFVDRIGERAAANQLQISRTALRKVLKAGVRNSSAAIRKRFAQGLSAL
jgi:hypothetical protein